MLLKRDPGDHLCLPIWIRLLYLRGMVAVKSSDCNNPCCGQITLTRNGLNLKLEENNHHYRLKIFPMTTKSCTYQDSTAVLVCAKFGCDRIDVGENSNDLLIKFENGLI